jgi:voltage-gated potassium channel
MLSEKHILFKILFLFGLIFLGLSFGTIGYMYFESWNFLDAFYMTVITVSTVGYKEVGELSVEGRIFTIILIFFSFATIAYAVSSITTFIASGEYHLYLKNLKYKKRLLKMENHVVICGFGRVGKQVANDLITQNIPVIIIENSKDVIEQNSSKKHLFIYGDASQDEIIMQAKLKDAKAFITCLPKDADNLYAILAVREMNQNLNIISRASDQHAVSKLKSAGANHVIMPDVIGGTHMASLVSSPDLMEFMDNIKSEENDNVNVESISYDELTPEFQNKTIIELETKKITGVSIIGYKSPSGEYIVNPDDKLKVVEKSKLFVIGNKIQITEFRKLFNLKR